MSKRTQIRYSGWGLIPSYDGGRPKKRISECYLLPTTPKLKRELDKTPYSQPSSFLWRKGQKISMRYSPQNTKVLISSTCDVLSSFLREGEEFPYGALCVTTSFLQGSSQGTKKIRFTTCQETKNLCHTHSQIHGRYDDLPKTDISISDEAFNQLVKSRKFSFFLSSKWQIDEGIICHFTPLPCNFSQTKKEIVFSSRAAKVRYGMGHTNT